MIEIDFPSATAMRTKAKYNQERIINEEHEKDKGILPDILKNIKLIIESRVEEGYQSVDYRPTIHNKCLLSPFLINEIIKFLKNREYKIKYLTKNNGYFSYSVFRISW